MVYKDDEDVWDTILAYVAFLLAVAGFVGAVVFPAMLSYAIVAVLFGIE